MFSLKKFFYANPCLLPVSGTEKELLECFLDNKTEFEHWISFQGNQRIRFQFYYPTAIDFYFDGHRMFTVYFKRDAFDRPALQELKMSRENYTSIRSANWEPFEQIIRNFLSAVAENNKVVSFRNAKSLHEYADLCQKNVTGQENKFEAKPHLSLFKTATNK